LLVYDYLYAEIDKNKKYSSDEMNMLAKTPTANENSKHGIIYDH
jgi:hypothetical protein